MNRLSSLPVFLAFAFAAFARAQTPTAAPFSSPRPMFAAKLGWPDEKVDDWCGGKRHIFKFRDHEAWVTEPANPRHGNPWVWCTEFPTAFVERTGVPQLIKDGFYHVYLNDYNNLGCPQQLELMDAFYAELQAHGLNRKAALIGLSRGGFMAFRWAEQKPGAVACIYGDAPVCDLRSWPGGKANGGPGRTGDGSAPDWAHFKQLYHLPSDTAALEFTGEVLETAALRPLVGAGVPILCVVGDADTVVPPAENANVLTSRYQQLGGQAAIIHVPGKAHHPHGLDQPAPIVDFIEKNASR